MITTITRTQLNAIIAQLWPYDNRSYDYGGDGLDGNAFDCSSWASFIYCLVLGLPNPHGRRFNTESDFDALGFEDGYDATSVMNIGVMRGGGGPNSHMAVTLDGVPTESSGDNGVQYGLPARGALHKMFPLHWHLPVRVVDDFLGGLTDEQQQAVWRAFAQFAGQS